MFCRVPNKVEIYDDSPLRETYPHNFRSSAKVFFQNDSYCIRLKKINMDGIIVNVKKVLKVEICSESLMNFWKSYMPASIDLISIFYVSNDS